MSTLDETKSRDELVAELDVANASYDWAKAKELEAAIKKLDEQGATHKQEMTEKRTIDNQQKAMKMEELTNLLQDKPENAEKNAETIKEQAKTRLFQTNERYINKIKELKNTNAEEVIKLKAEVKKEKDTYEKIKNDFFWPAKYNFEKFTKEDLAKLPTSIIRYATRENKLLNSPKLTKMKTLRRNITIKTLIKKLNKLWDNPTKGVRFIMNFEKARFLRYTSIKAVSWLDQAASAIGFKKSPTEFHAFLNAGKNNLFAILDADTGDEKTKGEIEVINAIKNRINYYQEAYEKGRASEWISWTIEEKQKDIKLNVPNKDQTYGLAA